jgi:hypothetical protein
VTTHYIEEKDLGRAMRREAKKVPRVLAVSGQRAAYRGKARLIAATDEKGITDMGQYKNSFHVQKGAGRVTGATPTPAILFNDAPMAGVIELGARPHPVSQEGIEAIAAWARRKMGLGQVEVSGPVMKGAGGRKKFARGVQDDIAMGIAISIARKIRAEGQKGRFVFADELGTLRKYWREEFERALREANRSKP